MTDIKKIEPMHSVLIELKAEECYNCKKNQCRFDNGHIYIYDLIKQEGMYIYLIKKFIVVNMDKYDGPGELSLLIDTNNVVINDDRSNLKIKIEVEMEGIVSTDSDSDETYPCSDWRERHYCDLLTFLEDKSGEYNEEYMRENFSDGFTLERGVHYILEEDFDNYACRACHKIWCSCGNYQHPNLFMHKIEDYDPVIISHIEEEQEDIFIPTELKLWA